MEKKSEYAGLDKLYNVLEYLREHLSHDGKECPIQKATIFLTVVLHEGITHAGIKEVQGFHQTTISRNLKELALFKDKNEFGDWVDKGCGLVVPQPYEYNRREHAMFLSVRGKRIAKKALELITN